MKFYRLNQIAMAVLGALLLFFGFFVGVVAWFFLADRVHQRATR